MLDQQLHDLIHKSNQPSVIPTVMHSLTIPNSNPRSRNMSINQPHIRPILIQALPVIMDSREFASKDLTADFSPAPEGFVYLE